MIYTRDGFFFCSLIFQLEFLISFNYFPLCSCCFLFQCNFVFWFVYLWFNPHTITRHVACEWFLFCNTSPFPTYQLKHIKGHYTIIMWSRICLQIFVFNYCVFYVKSNDFSEDNSMSREKKICKLRWSEVSCPAWLPNIWFLFQWMFSKLFDSKTMLVREQTMQIQMALVIQPLNVVPEVDQTLVHVLVDMEFAVHVSFLKI